jgi:hypothetical protein
MAAAFRLWPILPFNGLEFFAEMHHYLGRYWYYLPIIALD